MWLGDLSSQALLLASRVFSVFCSVSVECLILGLLLGLQGLLLATSEAWHHTRHPFPPALMISFEEQKFLILMKSSLSVFPFIVSACLCVPGNLSYPLNCLSVCQNLLTMCPWICMICFLSLIYVSVLTNTTLFWSSLKHLEIKYCKFYSLFPRYFGN